MFTQTCALVTCHVSRTTQDTVNNILCLNMASVSVLKFCTVGDSIIPYSRLSSPAGRRQQTFKN